MKQFLMMCMVMLGCAFSSPVLADGGMVSVAPTTQPTATQLSPTQGSVPLLSKMASLYSQMIGQMIGIPDASETDEGLLTVVVNNQTVRSCNAEFGVTGEQCVGHRSRTFGRSEIDVTSIPGFEYDDRFSYALTLVRTRNEGSGYTFSLVGFSDLTYKGW